jgi:uncharacterized protein (DUF1778 family)
MVSSRKTPAKAPTKNKKDDVVRMRVTAEQKAAILAAAESDGMDVSVWLRRLALREAGVLPSGKRKA